MAQEQDKERAQPVARGWQVEALLDGKWVPQWPVDATREAAEKSMGFFEQTVEFRVVPLYAAPQPNAALADGWMDTINAPVDTDLVVAAEFFGPGDWRIKMGYLDSRTQQWIVRGASWTPTLWQYPPAPPTLNASKGEQPC